MANYSHKWDAAHEWHHQVNYNERDYHPEGWEHPKTRQLKRFYALTVNEHYFNWLSEIEPEETSKLFHCQFEDLGEYDQVRVIRCLRQYDPILPWTDEDNLNKFIKSQISDRERIILKHKGVL